ncbi:MAG: AI-2E family transporter [Bacilli bacterium]
MNLTKKQIKTILFFIAFAIILFVSLQHLNIVLDILLFILILFMPFILGICIAFVLNVLLKIIENKLFKKLTLKNGKIWSKIKRPIALLLSLIIVFGFVIFLLVLIIPELKNAVTIFIDNIPIYQEKVIDLANKLNLSNDTIQIIKNGWENLTDSLFSFLKNNSKDFIQMTLGITTSIVSGIMNFILGLVFAIYMLADKEKLIKQTKKLLYALLPKKKVEKVLYVTTVSNRVFSKFITGQVTEAVIIGLLCFIGMLILHLPYASTISVLVGFTALIPVFGAFIGTAIGAILIFVVDPLGALIFITYIIILQQFEGNLIYPKVVGSSVGLPGIWVMLAVIIGGSLYGIVGMLLSVPICSILYVLLAKKVNEKLKKIKQNIN